MSDLSEFDELDPGVSCAFARARAKLSDVDRESLDAALARTDPKPYAHMTFVRFFERRNLAASEKTVRRHRLGECSCGR